MNLSRCENGHFYDKEKFASCPHCAQGVQKDESLTSVFTEDLDSGLMPTQPLDEVTVDNKNGIAATGEMQQNAPGGFPTPPMPSAPPYGYSDTLDSSITIDSIEDDDHTVAFYDDIFSPQPAGGTEPVRSQIPSGNFRVSTPCVGWLVALKGVHVGQDYRLKAGKNFIGRDSKMDILLDGDKSVSRNKHAIVVYEPKKHLYLVQPGESSELVYLNDTVVLNPMKLSAYDIITVGEVDLLFMPLCGEKFNWTETLRKKK